MWIVWYAATIGSLSALSLLPIMAPTKIGGERQPEIDGSQEPSDSLALPMWDDAR
jgi:hypothetical protein